MGLSTLTHTATVNCPPRSMFEMLPSWTASVSNEGISSSSPRISPFPSDGKYPFPKPMASTP